MTTSYNMTLTAGDVLHVIHCKLCILGAHHPKLFVIALSVIHNNSNPWLCHEALHTQAQLC